MTAPYSPVEEAIVCDWLRWPRPARAAGIRVDHPVALRNLKAVFPDAIRPQLQADGLFGPHTLANAVARLALSSSPHRRAHGQRSSAPLLLTEVDWERPEGFRFEPEAYFVGDLPGFGLKVVIASRESPETYGYHAIAVGSFESDRPVVLAAAQVVRSWWTRLADEGWDRWDSVLRVGKLPEVEVERWADEIWGLREVGGAGEATRRARGGSRDSSTSSGKP